MNVTFLAILIRYSSCGGITDDIICPCCHRGTKCNFTSDSGEKTNA